MDRPIRYWAWAPQQLGWWIAVLFMIGASLFALGSALFLAKLSHAFLLASIFFTGSLFFTSAAFCQFQQARNTSRTAFWSPFSQLIGTLMFNMNTFDAFFDFGWFAQDLLVWTPDILGSILFQISGSLALIEICKRWWCWNIRQLTWWIGAINFAGCVAFLVSAILAFTPPAPTNALIINWATTFTLIGAICFFAGAFLIWSTLDRKSD